MPYKDPDRQREYQRLRAQRIRAELLDGRSCQYCGSTDQLEFHHFDPYDKVSHRVISWAPARRDAELAKCLLLCRSCHMEHHRAARPQFCKYGHEFTKENTYVKPSTGRRECLTCKRARAKRAA